MRIVGAEPGPLTSVGGIRLGHWHDEEAGTGCTVIIPPTGAVCGVDVGGGGPGSREHAILSAQSHLQEVHGVLLTGGSAFGLDAAAGVVRHLEEQGVGYPTSYSRVPLVPAAVIYDLGVGRSDRRPGPEEGYRAAAAATSEEAREGNVGAGCGASVGKGLGMHRACKGGLGMARADGRLGVPLAALAVVNSIGEVVDPADGTILAGARNAEETGFSPMLEEFLGGGRPPLLRSAEHTTLIVVALGCALDKAGATRCARQVHDALARTIRPVHTRHDGDTVFVIATGGSEPPPLIGAWASEVAALAIVRAVEETRGLGGFPAGHEVRSRR